MRVDKKKFVSASGVSQMVFHSVLEKMQSCILTYSRKEGKESGMRHIICTTLSISHMVCFGIHGVLCELPSFTWKAMYGVCTMGGPEVFATDVM